MASSSEEFEEKDQRPRGAWMHFLKRNQRYLSALGTLLVIAFFGAAIFHLTAEV